MIALYCNPVLLKLQYGNNTVNNTVGLLLKFHRIWTTKKLILSKKLDHIMTMIVNSVN